MLIECDQPLPWPNQPWTVAARTRTLTCVAVSARGKSIARKVRVALAVKSCVFVTPPAANLDPLSG